MSSVAAHLVLPGARAAHLLPTTAALAALAIVTAGLLLPWLTVLHGTVPLDGIAAGGGTLAGVAAASALVIVAAHRYGWPSGRWFALGASAVAAAGSVWAARSIEDYAAQPGPAGALATPEPGPGPWVLAAGAAALVAVALLPVREEFRGPGQTGAGQTVAGLPARLGLAATAFTAGWIHLLLVPEHWGESALLGAGFLGAGVVQLALALAVVERPGPAVHLALVAVNVALVAVWLYAVFVGLPAAGAHTHGDAGWAVGAGEPIDLVAIVAKAAEITGAVWAGVLASRPIRPELGSELKMQPARSNRSNQGVKP